MKLKVKKTLDIQNSNVPDEVRTHLFNLYEKCNDVWVEHEVGISEESLGEGNFDILDTWIIENTDAENEDEILINYWW